MFLAQLAVAVDSVVASVKQDLQQLQQSLLEQHQKADADLLLTVQKLTLDKFTPADSSQARLLRLLKTLDYLLGRAVDGTDTKQTPQSESSLTNLLVSAGAVTGRSTSPVQSETRSESKVSTKDDANFITTFMTTTAFGELWSLLNQCLNYAHDNPKMVFVATVLLPLIECLMIAGKYVVPLSVTPASTIERRTSSSVSILFDPTLPAVMSHELFFAFTERHRKVLNTLVRINPKLLRGSFSLLVRNLKVLEFDNKRNYFTQKLHKKTTQNAYRGQTVNVNVRRQYIFQDSYYQLQNRAGDEIKYGKLSVKFHDEEGADYGGISREWFQELTKEIVNPNYALFTPSAEKMGVTYQPNPSSGINPSHLLYFKFVGRIIGKAIYDGKLVDCYFTRSVYKHMLGKPTDTSDMEAVDPEYHKSLVWILENDITDVLDLTFSMEMEEFGQQKIVDLKPDGRNIVVTQSNKHEYVQLVVENRLTNAIREQITAFLSGFHDIIPKELVAIFNEKELELLISGVPDIDIDDWKNNAEYRGYSSTSPQIQWFWRAVRSFDQEERAKLLQFTTGTSKVPLEGFSHLQGVGGKQKFQIHKDFGNVQRLPSAHTCFNQIDMPVYESYDQLKERLYKSMTEGAIGFGFE